MAFNKLSSAEKKSHLRNLMSVAFKDGVIEDAEKDVLAFAAQKWGLSQEEIDEVFANPDAIELAIPEDRDTRFQQLYELTEMMIIDGEMKIAEKDLCLALADKMGFDPSAVEIIVHGIIDGNESGQSEEMIQLRIKGHVKDKA